MKLGDAQRVDSVVAKKLAGRAKQVGRTLIPSFNEDKWKEVSFFFMARVLLQKVRQHPELRAQLLATEDAYIAEAAHYDKIWGIGLRWFAEDGNQGALQMSAEGSVEWNVPPAEWPSNGNLLGRALMLVRYILAMEEMTWCLLTSL